MRCCRPTGSEPCPMTGPVPTLPACSIHGNRGTGPATALSARRTRSIYIFHVFSPCFKPTEKVRGAQGGKPGGCPRSRQCGGIKTFFQDCAAYRPCHAKTAKPQPASWMRVPAGPGRGSTLTGPTACYRRTARTVAQKIPPRMAAALMPRRSVTASPIKAAPPRAVISGTLSCTTAAVGTLRHGSTEYHST